MNIQPLHFLKSWNILKNRNNLKSYPLNKKAISVIKYIILLAIGVVLLWIAFRKVDLPKMIADIKNANLFWVGLSVVTSLVAFTSRAIRWNLLIEPLGYKPKLSNCYFWTHHWCIVSSYMYHSGSSIRIRTTGKFLKWKYFRSDEKQGTFIYQFTDINCNRPDHISFTFNFLIQE